MKEHRTIQTEICAFFLLTSYEKKALEIDYY